MAVVTDTIGDMLTRIRNANSVRKETVDIPSSKLKEEIASKLKKEGYITDYKVKELDNKSKVMTITLKYKGKERAISGIKRISKPGLRVYAESKDIPYVLNGLGRAIISTSEGLMTDKEARQKNLGGEVLLYVW